MYRASGHGRLRHLPDRRRPAGAGAESSLGAKIRTFRRNICDFNLLQAQTDLQRQQGKNGMYFIGGYTNGIGLHENCLEQSAAVAAMLERSPQQKFRAAAHI